MITGSGQGNNRRLDHGLQRRTPPQGTGKVAAQIIQATSRKLYICTVYLIGGTTVTITRIKTFEGWLYLAVVIDLFSQAVIGWSMQSRIDRELVISALLMAIWRRQPEGKVLLYSDQGSQFTSDDWRSFLEDSNFTVSMSWRGSCYDNAVVGGFFPASKARAHQAQSLCDPRRRSG